MSCLHLSVCAIRVAVSGFARRGLVGACIVLAVALQLSMFAVPGSAQPAIVFTEVSEDAGVRFTHDTLGYYDLGGNPFQDHIGPGATWVDINRDGWLDLVVANGTTPGNYFFLNNGDGTFTDVSDAMDVRAGAVSNSVVAADIDNNGLSELWVTNHFAEPDIAIGNQFSLNRSSGALGLRELFYAPGTAPEQWDGPQGACGIFGDYDNDGFVDMYLVNQLTAPDMLLRNLGGARFIRTDLIDQNNAGFGFQAIFWDFDNDGDQDIFQANDTMVDFLFRNEGPENNWAFTEVAGQLKISGGAQFWDNKVMGMGTTIGDFDNDLDEDIYITNYRLNTLFQNPGDWATNPIARFREVAGAKGVDFDWNSWGCSFMDADNDGDLDLFVVAGHVESGITPQPFDLPNQFFRNDGAPDYTYTNISDAAGVAGAERLEDGNVNREIGRGITVGDYDRDGDLDVVVTNNTYFDPAPGAGIEPTLGHTLLYRNDTPSDHRWVMFQLQGGGPRDDGTGVGTNRDGIGCKVYVTADGATQMRSVMGGNGYMGMDSIEVEFGLGQASTIEEVRVVWTGGVEEYFTGCNIDGFYRLVEGAGEAIAWPVALSRFDARSTTDGIELQWWGAPSFPVESVRVFRRLEDDAQLIPIEIDVTQDAGQGMAVDTTAEAGTRYGYRIVLLSPQGNSTVSATAFATYEPSQTSTPRRPVLQQNFPNPFNPGTVIRFELPRRMQVSLKLYDARGRLMSTLYEGMAEPGLNPIVWNGTDDQGRSVASGIYFYTLETEEETTTRKLNLLR